MCSAANANGSKSRCPKPRKEKYATRSLLKLSKNLESVRVSTSENGPVPAKLSCAGFRLAPGPEISNFNYNIINLYFTYLCTLNFSRNTLNL